MSSIDRSFCRGRLFQLFVGLIIFFGFVVAACHSPTGDSAENDYRRFLNVSGIKAFYYTEPQTHNRYPLVQGMLSNSGAQKLGVVELTISFKDHSGKTIFEDHGYPVFASGYSSHSNLQQLLMPGQRIPFAIKSTQCPSSWREGDVAIVVSKVVFAKSL